MLKAVADGVAHRPAKELGTNSYRAAILTEGDFGVGKLLSQFRDRVLQIIASLRHRPRTDRVGKVARIVDAGAIFLGAYLGFQRTRHSFKIGGHGFDLRDPLARGLRADLPQAIEPLANSPVAIQSLAAVKPEAASEREIPAVRN